MSREIAPAPALNVRQAASRIVARQVRELLRWEKAAARGDDPEAVHQMRVQTRRLRAARALFRGVLRLPKGARGDRLRWLARSLGRVRDLDVIIALLEERHLPALGGEEAARLEDLLAALKERRWRAQRKLTSRLAGGRFHKLRTALKDGARHPRFEGEGPEEEVAARYLTDAIYGEADRVTARRAMTERTPSPADLHALRITIKRLRYLLDFHAETCGVAFDAERRLARQLQDCLGEIHDHDLLLGWLAAPPAKARGRMAKPPVEAALFAGAWRVLPERLTADRAALLRRFQRLRRQWRARTEPRSDVAPLAEPRFVNLEAAPVQLRIAAPQKTVASLRIVR